MSGNHKTKLGRLAAIAAFALTAACDAPDKNALTVQVSLTNETPSVVKGTLVVDYSRTGAKIVSHEGGPACAFILPGINGSFTDDGRGALTVRVQSKRGVRGPADLIACRMLASKDDATAGDIRQRLEVKLTEAEDSAGKPIDLTLPMAKARRTTPTSPEAPADEAAAAGKMAAAIEAKAAANAEDGAAKATKPAPPVAVPKPVAPAPAAPVARPPAPPPSGPSGPASAGRSVVNNPGASAANRAGAFPGSNSNDNNNSPGLPNDDDDPFDSSAGEDDSAPQYEVTASVIRSVGVLGALQFEIIYQGDSGGWAERGANVLCDTLIKDGLAATNNPGRRDVKVGLVSLQGINTPNEVVRCIFRSHDERVTAKSFTINVTDASDIKTDPLPAIPTMTVTRVVAI